MPTAAAVIPHWNRRDLLETLLPSLRAQSRPFDEVIVVDNGSTDGSAEFAERAGAKVLRLNRNLGFAPAVNQGIASARSECVAILNNDVTLDAAWLENLLPAVSQTGAWFATGKILNASNPTIMDGTFDEVSRGACAHRCGFGEADAPTWNRPRQIRFAPMTAALFRKELFSKVGLLDESFRSYLEDVDFGLRCALAGFSGSYVPSAIAYHRGSATLGEWNKATVRQISRNQVLLAAKYFRGQPRWPIVAGQLLWGLLALRHGRAVAWAGGKLAGIRDARGIVSLSDSEEKINRVGVILKASEESILSLAAEGHLDSYWRAYFWLSRR
jgi:GT2 family glycosyltransferase